MQATRDDLKDSFYLYIMRSSIGAGLRSEYAADEPLPDRLAELLRELDEPDDQVSEEKRDAPRLHKHIRGG
jgi:Anti-sigma factor NepR